MPNLVTFDEYYKELVVILEKLSARARQQQEANRDTAAEAAAEEERLRRLARTRGNFRNLIQNAYWRKKLADSKKTAPTGLPPSLGTIRVKNADGTESIEPLPGFDPEAQGSKFGAFLIAIEWSVRSTQGDAFQFRLENELMNGIADFRQANTHIFAWNLSEQQIEFVKVELETTFPLGLGGQVITELVYGPVNPQVIAIPDRTKVYPGASDFNSGGGSTEELSAPGKMLIQFLPIAGTVFDSDTWVYTGYADGNQIELINNDRYVWPANTGGTSTVFFS